MNLIALSEYLKAAFYVIAALAVVVIAWTWIFFPFKILGRLDTMINQNEKMLALLNRRRDSAESTEEDSSLANCQCFHCGQNIPFEKTNYDPNNAIIDCPSCGKRTKISVPVPMAETGI